MSKIHVNEPDIPTDLAERKQWIDELYDHAIWEYGDAISYASSEILGYTFDAHTWRASDSQGLMDVRPAYVNPETHLIDDNEDLNTHSEVWIEAGPMGDRREIGEPEPPEAWNDLNRWMGVHDIRLDCGADTLEGALLILMARIKTFYNEDGTSNDLNWCIFQNKTCEGEIGSFCPNCGFRVTERDPEE